MNAAIKPDSLSPDERLVEIAEILAAGLIHLRVRKSSQLSPDSRESSLVGAIQVTR
jgi:hypothetical protein